MECLNAVGLVRLEMEIIIAAVSSCTSQHMIENFKSKLKQWDSLMPYVGLAISIYNTLLVFFGIFCLATTELFSIFVSCKKC